MAPYILMAVTDSFQLGLHPVTALTQLTGALTLFLYLFQAVCMDTSSVSEQEKQSPEAVSKSESAIFPLDKPESEDV